nr:YchJ family metal-binding protein [Nocardioides zeae]
MMRSRYAAYAVGGLVGADHLFRTWHPRTRPDDPTPDDGLTWTGLTVEATEAGGEADTTGVVTFTARYSDAAGEPGALRERSRFTRRAGRWVYVDGDVDA